MLASVTFATASWAVFVCSLSRLSGCSWTFVERRPPDYAEREKLSCTRSPAAPIVDTALASGVAILGGVLIYTGAACSESDSGAGGGYPTTGPCFSSSMEVTGGVLLLIPAAVLAASATTGFVFNGECRDAFDGLAREAEPASTQEPTP